MALSNRKKLLIIGIAVLAAFCLLLAAIPLLQWLSEEPEPTYDFVFADPSLSADIYADEDYLDLDRTIYYATNDGGYEIKTAIEPEDVTSYNKAVQLLIRWVQAATAGDEKAYNACFAEEYLAKSGKVADFTMQKIYDICITKYAVSTDTVLPEGYAEAYFYGLQYKIKDNNGSLRNDIESDSAREQYITVVVDAKGDAHIYGVRVLAYRPAS